MTRPEMTGRYQKALMWPVIGTDRYGQVRVGAPVELRVRWDWGRKEVLGQDGSSQSADATVIVDRRIQVGSLMWLGGLNDLPGTAQMAETDIMQVITYKGVKDVKGRSEAHSVDVMRFHEQQAIG